MAFKNINRVKHGDQIVVNSREVQVKSVSSSTTFVDGSEVSTYTVSGKYVDPNDGKEYRRVYPIGSRVYVDE